MVIPKTPISLEKNPDTDDPFIIHNGIHNGRHIIDTSVSFAFPLFIIDFNILNRESEMFLTRLIDHESRSFSLPRSRLRFPHLGESLWEPHESVEIDFPHFSTLVAPQPSQYSFGLSIFDCFIKESIETLKNPPKAAEKKDADNTRNQMFSLYHEFRVFYLRYSPLLNFQNEYHSEHKKLLRCCPSHFWQVLE